MVPQTAHPVYPLHTCISALAKLPCRRSCRRARIVWRWLCCPHPLLVSGGSTNTVYCIGAFCTPYTDPLWSLLSNTIVCVVISCRSIVSLCILRWRVTIPPRHITCALVRRLSVVLDALPRFASSVTEEDTCFKTDHVGRRFSILRLRTLLSNKLTREC